jgi:hypothetical protein
VLIEGSIKNAAASKAVAMTATMNMFWDRLLKNSLTRTTRKVVKANAPKEIKLVPKKLLSKKAGAS